MSKILPILQKSMILRSSERVTDKKKGVVIICECSVNGLYSPGGTKKTNKRKIRIWLEKKVLPT